MKWLAVLLILVLLSQVAIFFYTRKLKRENKNHVLNRYKIKSAKEAWEVLHDPDLPEEDRKEIERIYHDEKH